jgi:ubiquinone/menaquinone biosynthesis C-methylase UbiE
VGKRDVKEASAGFFEKVSTDYYAEKYGDKRNISAYGMTRRLEKVLEIISAFERRGRLIDFGCGPAITWEGASALGYEYYGIDISPGMLAEGAARASKERIANPPKLVVGDVTAHAFEDGVFDIAVAMGLMDYLPDERAFYNELYRVLVPGGLAVVTYSNRCSWANLVRHAVKPVLSFLRVKGRVLASDIETGTHTPRREAQKLEIVGFRVERVVYSGAHIIPFGLNMPGAYFRLVSALERLYNYLRFRPGLSSFTLVLRKNG